MRAQLFLDLWIVMRHCVITTRLLVISSIYKVVNGADIAEADIMVHRKVLFCNFGQLL